MRLLITIVTFFVAIVCEAQSQSTLPGQTDSTVRSEDSRNIMLNAESATVPREINVGLPESGGGAPIQIDGARQSHGFTSGSFHWAGGNAYQPLKSISFMESVIRIGEIGVCVDSYTKLGGDSLEGVFTASTSINGLIHFDGYLGGPISNGWYYSAGAYVHFDPTSVNSPSRTFIEQKQIYHVAATKRWKTGEFSFLYHFSSYGSSQGGGYCRAPFIYNGNGSISELNGFRIGRDCYMPAKDDVSYLDIKTGETKTESLGKIDNVITHDITARGRLNTESGWELYSTLHACITQPSHSGKIYVAGISNVTAQDGYTKENGETFEGDLQSRYVIVEDMKSTSVEWLTETRKQLGKHYLKAGMSLVYTYMYNAGSSFNFAHTVTPNPERLYCNGAGTWAYNRNGQYVQANNALIPIYAFDDWNISDRWFLRFGLRLKPTFRVIDTAANMDGDGEINKRVQNFTVCDPSLCKIHSLTRIGCDYAASLHADFRIVDRLFFMTEGFYSKTGKSPGYYKNETIPSEKPIGNALVRCGINYDNSFFEGSLLFSFVTAWNCAALINQSLGSITIPWTAEYGIKTPGVTFDGNFHFGGFRLHTLLTYQDPRYYNYYNEFDFGGGQKVVVDYNDKVVTGISKFMMELDPSYSWEKVRMWLSIRYNSRQYASRTNYAYFNGHFETFAGADWKINRHHKLALNIVNLFFQNGVKGSIGVADVITDPALLEGYYMSGAYIRPFSVDLKYTFSF